MRSLIAVVSAVAMLVAQMPPGFAQSSLSTSVQPVVSSAERLNVNVSPDIVNAFNAFPKGGDQLSKRVSDIIVKNPRLATGMVKYLQARPDMSREQKLAAEQGLASALNRLGIKAADMPVKAPPVQAESYCEWCWLLALAAIAALICVPDGGPCRPHHDNPPPVSPL